jgi:hypothetical protein
MAHCQRCGKETPLKDALLSQDFYANTLEFCSVDCLESWFSRMLATQPTATTTEHLCSNIVQIIEREDADLMKCKARTNPLTVLNITLLN